jgi:anti-sigma-K factor RskA
MSDVLDHDGVRELIPLHAIGALSGAERDAVEAHLATCADCAAELRGFAPVGIALAQIAPQVDPPATLRAAILAAAKPPAATTRAATPILPWFAAAAMFVITAGMGFYVASLQQRIRALEGDLRAALLRVEDSERRVNVALRAAADAQTPLTVLTAPDVRQINLTGQPAAPTASARAFWSRSRGMVITAANLPQLPPDRIYQLWFVTKPAPVSAGLLTPDANGSLTTTLTTPSDVPAPSALAVTIEPAGGVLAPTGAMYLVGAAQ